MTERKTPRPASPRKPYAKPRLTRYGHVKDVVQGFMGPQADAGGPKTKPCWVAEALYGAGDARTVLLRAWMAELHALRRRGWLLTALYLRIGPAVAALVRRGTVPRAALRPLFDRLLDRALADTTRRIKGVWHPPR